METRTKFLAIATLAVVAFGGCSNSSSNEPTGTGGAGGTGGATSSGGSGSGGKTSTGGSSGSGGATSTGGSSAAGGSSATGGSSAMGGSTSTGGTSSTGGATGMGGMSTTGGKSGTGGVGGGAGGTSVAGGGSGSGGTGSGGTTGTGGTTTTGGAGGSDAGGKDAGGKDAGGAEAGPDSGSTGFAPCPTNGDPCKVLPLGDSITWGINYGGGYRIKLFTHTVTDSKNITFVGYDTANPPDSTALSKLGSSSSKWVAKHEGHSGWTIQQDDDLVTGKSTATNDGVNYTGKKVVADFNPNIVLVHLGTNDMYGSNPGGAPTRLGTLIDDVVAAAPDALVVVASIIPFPSGASATATFNKAVPGVVQQRADAGKHVIYVDMFSALTTADLGSDQVHPNEGGYEKMAVVWYTAIKSYLH
jgi:hypothetical protein